MNNLIKSMMNLKLNQDIYYADLQEYEVIKHIIIGIYTLKKVKQDRDYYFNSPNQLIATISEKDREYDIYIKSGLILYPIERYKFKSLDEIFEKYFLKKEDAEKYVKRQKEYHINAKKEERLSKITELEERINILKAEDTGELLEGTEPTESESLTVKEVKNG